MAAKRRHKAVVHHRKGTHKGTHHKKRGGKNHPKVWKVC